jgi:hypothetical protein
MAAVARAAARTGTIAGAAAGGDHELVRDFLGDGPTLLAYSADVRLYAEALRKAADGMRARWGATE